MLMTDFEDFLKTVKSHKKGARTKNKENFDKFLRQKGPATLCEILTYLGYQIYQLQVCVEGLLEELEE